MSCPWPLSGKKMAGRREEGWSPPQGSLRKRLDVPLSPSKKVAVGGKGWVEEGRARISPATVCRLGRGLRGREGMWHPPRQKSGNVRPGFSLGGIIEVGRGKS